MAIRALLSARSLRPHHVPALGAGADTVLCHAVSGALRGDPACFCSRTSWEAPINLPVQRFPRAPAVLANGLPRPEASSAPAPWATACCHHAQPSPGCVPTCVTVRGGLASPPGCCGLKHPGGTLPLHPAMGAGQWERSPQSFAGMNFTVCPCSVGRFGQSPSCHSVTNGKRGNP